MPRNRVLSFVAQLGAPRSPSNDPQSSDKLRKRAPSDLDISSPRSNPQLLDASNTSTPSSPSTPSRARGDSKPKRLSMLQGYNPPQVEVANDTPPELQPIFTYLNSHSNKLYQEGYFLKLHDLDVRGRPSPDRAWTECFAQLIGTVLSLWDAAALDVAGEDAEVVPTFINLSDASIKMIESLPMNGVQGGHLQNVLSISTAANNRYLLHFNTLNSLTQWTAGIRLAMFEHCTLQEAYTGSLIAGKGRMLNNIKQIMFPLKFAHEDWARVRFGAGTPWQRCWCVISPADEKELDKAKKAQKKSSYDRVKMPRGDIKFYDTRKVTKKTKPIATVSEAYAAYAIYPQSKPLIEQSTLVKVEGVITLHDRGDGRGQPPHEGFVFVMPEVHQMVSGFEIMLRWLFPTFDTFQLYGRPTKLIADTLDQRGLMFAMPTSRRYGYLDILDVSSLIHTRGSQNWTERQWRREMKKLTGERMMNQAEGAPRPSIQESRRRNTENTRPGVRFGEGEMARSTPGSRSASPVKQPGAVNGYPQPPDSAPPGAMNKPWSPHKRAQSEAQGLRKWTEESQSRPPYGHGRSDSEEDFRPPPGPPPHSRSFGEPSGGRQVGMASLERITSGLEAPSPGVYQNGQQTPPSPHLAPPTPVSPPPAFLHPANSRPVNEPYAAPELRRANSNVDAATLQEMQEAMRQQPDSTYEDGGTWDGVIPQRQQQNPVALNHYEDRAPADSSQGPVNRFQHGQRLSTIPASPFVGSDAEYFHSPLQQSVPQFDGVEEQEEFSTPLEKSESTPSQDRSAPPVPLHTTQSIARKPVPRATPRQTPSPDDYLPVPQERPALSRSLTDPTNSPIHVQEGWENMIINEVALEEQLNASPVERASTMKTTSTKSSEPDYASTASVSTKPKQSIERPRAGRLKTVGNTEIPNSTSSFEGNAREILQPNSSSDVPDIDFGRTYDYTRMIGSHPQSSLGPAPVDTVSNRRSLSTERLLDFAQRSSPSESKRLSYFDGGRTPTQGGRSPTPSGGVRTPEPFEERSTVLWPGASPSPPQVVHRSKTSVSPEDWVAQRAAIAQEQPQYAPMQRSLADRLTGHNRSSSVQNPAGRRKLTKTPPLSRHLSGDWGRRSPTPTPRPSSRGAGINLDTVGRSPSAMEQMQISRATGTPLVDLAQNAKPVQEPSPGMLDIVSQRERDRAASREGRNSMLVQHAIERQQQHQHQQRMEAEAQAQAQAQLQMQAEQQYQMQLQQQQQMAWNQQMYVQNQQYQQRPVFQQSNSFQGMYQSGYNAPSSVYSTATDNSYQAPRPQQQAYGSGYMAQQQQQYSRR